jgi:hypothetical protein
VNVKIGKKSPLLGGEKEKFFTFFAFFSKKYSLRERGQYAGVPIGEPEYRLNGYDRIPISIIIFYNAENVKRFFYPHHFLARFLTLS